MSTPHGPFLPEHAALLDMTPALVRDGGDQITFWSEGAAELYGWSRAEALGKNAHELLRTLFPIPLEAIRAQLAAQGRWDGELIQTCKDGSAVVVASRWALHADAGGRGNAVLEIDQDITELKRVQETLQHSERRKDDFLGMLAHELRNPLAPILNALHIMRLARGNAAAVEDSRTTIERQVRHMVRLIDDLIDLSRITRGVIELRKQPVDLAELIEGAVESVRGASDSAGHALTVNVPAEPVVIEGDPARLNQVLVNLLTNAATYTEAGGRIWVTGRREGDDVVISVGDSGMGIPSQMLPNIFEMFAQVDRSLERSQGGLGIGLSLVRGLVRLHGGTVAARSEGPGRGSEFIVRLPLQHGDAAAPAAPPRDAPCHDQAAGRRILLVDDNVDGARSLEKLLRIVGHEIAVTHDGVAGLEKARVFKPDVIILDIGLPGINGYEVARRLRKMPGLAKTLLVAMTGWGKDEDRGQALAAGFDAHLVKPVELDDLQELLARPIV